MDWAKALGDFLAALPVALGPGVLHFGTFDTAADTTDRYLCPGYDPTPAATVEVKVRVPAAGKVSALYVQAATGPVTAGQVVTVRKNGVDTALAATLAAAGAQASDLAHSFTVAAGDTISVKVKGATGITDGATQLLVSMLFSGDAGTAAAAVPTSSYDTITVDVSFLTNAADVQAGFPVSVTIPAGLTPVGVSIVKAVNDDNPAQVFTTPVVAQWDWSGGVLSLTFVTGLDQATNYTLTLQVLS